MTTERLRKLVDTLVIGIRGNVSLNHHGLWQLFRNTDGIQIPYHITGEDYSLLGWGIEPGFLRIYRTINAELAEKFKNG